MRQIQRPRLIESRGGGETFSVRNLLLIPDLSDLVELLGSSLSQVFEANAIVAFHWEFEDDCLIFAEKLQ